MAADGELSLASGSDGIAALDLSEPWTPTVAWQDTTIGEVLEVSGAQGLALAVSEGALYVIDVEQPDRPRIVARVPIPAAPHRLPCVGPPSYCGPSERC